ncbi:MAG TPA: hypothetical protein VMG10_24345, partial [Gemmataceae bacterium]|nr:hypothetical protein [Gemmataceae bacterium]
TALTGAELLPASCATCNGGLLAPIPPPVVGDGIPCAAGCGCVQCYPGQIPCDCCGSGSNCITRLLGGLYHCICCPDPCYVSTWRPLANNAFFVDQVKPITQIKLGGDFANNYQFPDKAEFFWAQENAKGPHYSGPALPAGVKPPGAPNLNYSEGYLYIEGAVNRFSIFVNLPYLNVEPVLYPGASGFSDMIVGTKSLLLDCELVQTTFQFETFIPTGNFLKGLGTGHVSLEPSLIWALKLTRLTYWQGQVAYWFPIGGTPTFQGPVFNYHLAINQMLWQCGCEKGIQLIGSAELGGYEIAGGAYTSPLTGLPLSAKDVGSIVNAGPGLRLVFCNKIDFGVGSYFAITKDRMAAALGVFEFRWRF